MHPRCSAFGVTRLVAVKQRHALGLLFAFLGAALGLVALAAADAGEWVVTFGAAVIGGWLLLMAFQALRRR